MKLDYISYTTQYLPDLNLLYENDDKIKMNSYLHYSDIYDSGFSDGVNSMFLGENLLPENQPPHNDDFLKMVAELMKDIESAKVKNTMRQFLFEFKLKHCETVSDAAFLKFYDEATRLTVVLLNLKDKS